MKHYYSDDTGYMLTTLDLKALRHADAICFDLYWRNGRVSQVRAIKRRENTACGFDETVYIPAAAVVEDWVDEKYDPQRKYRCYEMLHHPQHSEVWKTIVSLMRAGDKIVLEWSKSGGNGYLEGTTTQVDGSSGETLYMYRLAVKIKRQMKKGTKTLTFNIRASICPNNTAAMVRREW